MFSDFFTLVNAALQTGPSTSVEFSEMAVQGTSHQGQSNEKILSECVSGACQTRALDLPPINLDAFNPIIIRFLEKLTEEYVQTSIVVFECNVTWRIL